jgi:pantoate--beta-alanine ligase
VTTRAKLREAVAAERSRGHSIGLVPTMGALHAGHLSLVEAARRECGFTVATIFVNPTQFGPGEDYQRYPRTLDADLAALASVGTDLLFAPPTEVIYRPGATTFVDVGPVAAPLEGQFRPGHFRGVATVVLKLFNLVGADIAYFGRKDYQQSLVIRRMVADLDVPIQVRVCPTVRESDGLALSSRNTYLDATARERALTLSRSLRLAQEVVVSGERRAVAIIERMRRLFADIPSAQIDYIALCDPETLEPVTLVDRVAVALLAVRIGGTRLIDNELIIPPSK